MKIYTLTIKQKEQIFKHKGPYYECLWLMDRLDLGLAEIELSEDTTEYISSNNCKQNMN